MLRKTTEHILRTRILAQVPKYPGGLTIFSNHVSISTSEFQPHMISNIDKSLEFKREQIVVLSSKYWTIL